MFVGYIIVFNQRLLVFLGILFNLCYKSKMSIKIVFIKFINCILKGVIQGNFTQFFIEE